MTTPADMGADAMSQIKPPLPEPAHTVKVWGLAEETYTAGQMHFYADTCTAALQARVAELEADAARWRYLRGEFYEAVIPHGNKLNGHRTAWIPRFVPLVPGEGIDAAIDAAMKETK